MQSIPTTSWVKIWPAAYHLSNAYCYYRQLDVIILLRVRCRKKYIFLVFSERKFRKVKHTFLTPSRQPPNRFSWNLASLLWDSVPQKPCRQFLFSFSVFEWSSFFQRKCWWFVPSDFILLSQMIKCMCQKSETRFFSRTCQEANAMFIILFRSFLAGLELNLHRHMLSQKTSQLRSLLRF